MLQSGRKELVALSPTEMPVNKSNLNDWDIDYIKDGDDHGGAYVSAPLSSKELLQLTCGSLLALLVLLLGVIACMIAGHQESQQSRMVWHIVNHIIAAFSAMLIFRASKELFQHFTTIFGFTYAVGHNFVLFVIAFVVAYFWLLKCDRMFYEYQEMKHRQMLIVGLVGMYTAAFAAITTYQMLVQLPDYVKFGSSYSFAFVCAALGIIGLVGIVSSIREVAIYEDQFASVVIGFLISQALEQAIIRSQPLPTAQLDTNTLFMVVIALLLLFLVTTALSKGDEASEPGRISREFRNVCLMTIAWCVFDGISWHVSGGYIGKTFGLAPQTQASTLLVALILSSVVLIVFVFLCLYSFVCYENPWEDFQISGFRLLVGAFGFIIGKAWADHVILLILGAGSHLFTPQNIALAAGTAVTCLLLTTLVLSIWICCLLPNSKLPMLRSEENIEK